MNGTLHLLLEIFLESIMSVIYILHLEVKHYLHFIPFVHQKPVTLSFQACHPRYFSNLNLNFAFISKMKEDSSLLMNFLYRLRSRKTNNVKRYHKKNYLIGEKKPGFKLDQLKF